MNHAHKPERELITGTGGSGKTSLYLQRIRASRARWKFIFDIDGDLADLLACHPATNRQELNTQIASGVCIYDPSKMYSDNAAGFEFFCDYFWEVSERLPGTKLLCCDEMQDVAGIDVAPKCPQYLKRVMERGRKREQDVLAISQAPNLLHNRVRNQFYRITTFMQTDDCAMKFLISAGHNQEEVRALRPGQFISRNKKTGETVRGEVFKAV